MEQTLIELAKDGSQRKYGETFGIKEYLKLKWFSKESMASLIDCSKVMGEDRLEVTGCLQKDFR